MKNIATIAFLCALLILSSDVWAQRGSHKAKGNASPSVIIVDDEACGCELVFIDGIQTTESNGLFGFKKADGTILVEPQYKFVDKFKDGFCVVLRDYYHYGLINREGKEILPCDFQEVVSPTEGLVRVKKGDLYGFYDTTGREVIPTTFAAASAFSEGLAVVAIQPDTTLAGIYGYIDHSGHFTIAPQYQYAYPFNEGRAVVKSYDRYGLIDAHNNIILPCKYENLSSVDEGRCFANFEYSPLYAMFDGNGRQITPFLYENIFSFGEGFYTVLRDGKYTFLDVRGKEHFGDYDRAGGFVNGYCFVARNGKYGIIDTRGRQTLPLEYDNSGYRSEEYQFFEGLALVEKDGRYGFVDTKGKIVIPLIYESGYHFTEGIVPVKKDGKWGYIDHDGKIVIPFLFDAASFFTYGRAEVMYKNTIFKINPHGQCLKNCSKFPHISTF